MAGKQPERLAELSAQLRKLYREVRDESPVWPAWKAPRYEGQRINAARKAGIWPEWKKLPTQQKK